MRYLMEHRALQKGKHGMVNTDKNVSALGKIGNSYNQMARFF